jgi:outer membrane protein assembly factor BamC
MMNTRISKRAGLAVSLGALVLTGCSAVNQLTGAEEPVNYKSTVRGEPLSIPPDLTQANQDTRFQAPEGPTTYSQYASSQQSRQNADNRDAVLPQSQGVEVMRDGDLRWLVVDRAPDDVYPRVIEFWGQQGFTIHSQDPKAGLIQTDWAENRAKIPQDVIRKTLGKVFDGLYSTSERDKFRTRLERGADGTTEVYITHRGMQEVYTSAQKDQTIWQPRPSDPELETEFLRRLMVKLGVSQEQADAVAKADTTAAAATGSVRMDTANGQPVLQIDEGFDRAWRRVGVALDRTGFTVEDRDRSRGIYFVRYVAPDAKVEPKGFFGKLFSRSPDAAPPVKYQIQVRSEGSKSTVSVLNTQGQPETSANAQRIVRVITDDMK